MNLDIKNIPDSHKAALREAYKNIYADFLIRSHSIFQEWAALKPILKELGITPKETNKQESELFDLTPSTNGKQYITKDKVVAYGFDKKGSWLDKSFFILGAKKKPLTANEIIDLLIRDYQPELERQKVLNSLHPTLSVAAGDGKIKRTRNDKNEWVYHPK